MARLNIDRNKLDHPEHFDDEIREFKHSERYVPTALEQILFELSGHRCTICSAPWLEVHHIDELSEGGETSYENLIVLCPNCHTRVHQSGVPSKSELRHYKLKQEVAHELPILSRLSAREKEIISHVASLAPEDQVVFSEKFHQTIAASTHEQAVLECRKALGLIHLQESGMIGVEESLCVMLSDGAEVSVNLNIRFSGKGIKWLRYLQGTGRVPTTDS